VVVVVEVEEADVLLAGVPTEALEAPRPEV
jgi:hypothetical protein